MRQGNRESDEHQPQHGESLSPTDRDKDGGFFADCESMENYDKQSAITLGLALLPGGGLRRTIKANCSCMLKRKWILAHEFAPPSTMRGNVMCGPASGPVTSLRRLHKARAKSLWMETRCQLAPVG